MGHVVRMTLTATVGFVFIFAVDAVNLYWLSQSGETDLVAAAGFAMAVQVISLAAGISMMVASTALVSRAIGAGRAELARRQTTSGAILAVLTLAPLALALIVFRHPILSFLGAQDNVADLAARYLLMSQTSLAVIGAAMVINGAIRAQGDARRSVAVTMAGGLMSLIFGYLLISVAGWGLDGAAITVIIASFANLLLAFRIARKHHDLLARPRLADIRETLNPFMQIALPAMLAQMSRPFGIVVLLIIVAPYGAEAVAGWSVLSRVVLVAFGGLLALGAAIGGIFGQTFGAGQFDRVRSTFRDATIFSIIYVLVVWALLYLLTEPIIAAFDVKGVGADIIRTFTTYGAGGFLFLAGFFVATSTFNVLGRPRWSTAFNWVQEGLLTWPAGMIMTASLGAVGVVYSQMLVGCLVGSVAWVVGLRYVRSLNAETAPDLDKTPAPAPAE